MQCKVLTDRLRRMSHREDLYGVVAVGLTAFWTMAILSDNYSLHHGMACDYSIADTARGFALLCFAEQELLLLVVP